LIETFFLKNKKIAIMPSLEDKSFAEYREKLKPEIESAESNNTIALTGYHDSIRSRQFKICSFKKAKSALKEYEDLMNGVVALAHQDAAEIHKSIEEHLKQTDTVKTAFDAVLEALRNTKKSLLEVETASRSLAEVVENSDQSEEAKWLKKKVEDFHGKVKKMSAENKEGSADAVNDLADDAFEVAVKVVGINASINLASLPPLSTQLQTDMTALKEDIVANLTFNQGEKQKAQQTLTAQNQAQSTSRATLLRACLNVHALNGVEAYIGQPHCKTGDELQQTTRTQLEKIAEDIEKTFY
jgi:hypothetical protein